MDSWTALFASEGSGGNDEVPADQSSFGGPWFQTQLELSLFIGILSFLFFIIFRTRWKVMFAPRTLLKGFSPHEVHDKDTYFGWILPTLRTSEFTVLQLVGLDAVVLLSFFKMGFYFFLTISVLGCTILMPINWREHGSLEGIQAPDEQERRNSTMTGVPDVIVTEGSTLYLTTHLIATYAFSVLALVMLHRTYARFVHTRQLFALDFAQSAPARTVLVSKLPPHLRNDRALAGYWEDMGEHMTVESVSMGREVDELHDLLSDRTKKLRTLEEAWTAYLGNPPSSRLTGYRRETEVAKILHQEPPSSRSGTSKDLLDGQASDDGEHEIANGVAEIDGLLEADDRPFVMPDRARPTKRIGWRFRKVDLLEHLAEEFRKADGAVRSMRRGRFHPTQHAFVTFETLAAAQIASQVVHYPQPEAMATVLAPEPRDVYWSNLNITEWGGNIRVGLSIVAMLLVLTFWGIPISYLARLLSFETIKRTVPRLAHIIESNERLRALVQNSLPTLALISFNGFLPMILESLCIFQGLRARSWIEYSILKKYFLFLIINVFFIFVAASTIALTTDLVGAPMKLFEKLATTLPGARIFFISYVMLQGLAIMPLQMVQLAVILPRIIFRVFFTRTPRDFAELNAPPTLNLGIVYPQAILVFIIGLTYSVISPLILPFTTIYFGLGYLVYKYKLLFVYYRTYESRGQAWPISFTRLAFGLVIHQVFMTSLFFLHTAWVIAATMVPLLLGTLWSCWRMHHSFGELSQYVNLSQAAEVERSASSGPGDVERLHKGYPVTRSQAGLNRVRYGSKDLDTAYIVAKDKRTDYSQPPMSDNFPGVLNTGRRRYAHPAIFGLLPAPWLPPTPEPDKSLDISADVTETVVMDLRQRWRQVKDATKHALHLSQDDAATRAWRGDASRASEENAGRTEEDLGVETINTDDDDDDDDSEDEREEGNETSVSPYRPFMPHPERRRSAHFPPTPMEERDVH